MFFQLHSGKTCLLDQWSMQWGLGLWNKKDFVFQILDIREFFHLSNLWSLGFAKSLEVKRRFIFSKDKKSHYFRYHIWGLWFESTPLKFDWSVPQTFFPFKNYSVRRHLKYIKRLMESWAARAPGCPGTPHVLETFMQ